MKISRNIKIATAVILAIKLASCTSDENTIATQQGYIKLSAEIKDSFTMADGTLVSLSELQVPEIADFSLALNMVGDENFSHTWQSFNDFPSNESYLIGNYDITMRAASKNDGPTFDGSKQVVIAAGQRTAAEIECAPAEALLKFDISQNSKYKLGTMIVHSNNGQYCETKGGENIFIEPGEMEMYAQLTDEAARSIRVSLPYTTSISAAHGEAIVVKLNDDELALTSTNKSSNYVIEKSIFDLSAPAIEAEGFTPGQEIKATEGITLNKSVKMFGTSNRVIKHARLTVESPILNMVSAPSEIDLAQLSSDDRNYLSNVGLIYTFAADKKSVNIDYTNLLENMSSYTSALSHFTLMLEDEAGVCSEPLTLDVNTQVMTISLESITTAELGINRATMQINTGGQDVEQPDFNIYAIDSDGNKTLCAITSWKKVDAQRIAVEFSVPEGYDDINIDVYYLDLKRFSTIAKRSTSDYTIDVDAYATNAIIKFDAKNEEEIKALVKYATVSITGINGLNCERYESEHGILVQNLQADTKYTVNVWFGDGTKQTSTFTTEKALQVPEGDFEDWEQLITYKQMPQGGKYSATGLSIVNRQNYTDIDVKWPKKYWASVNAKTFNKQSSRHNTWYMQPSSVIIYEPQSGYKAICMTSVGWDHNGEQIADYVQESGQSLAYSKVVPNIAHRSAGRLFLGSYSYDIKTQQEVFNEGYTFTSRPSSLNGFFMYTPDNTHPTDRGYVEVEIINITDGKETVIASGRSEFQAATDYKAFNVPLSYKYYNLKASKLKIMFASSTATGSQEYEDSHVPVTAHPETGVMSGSSLWIDNLSFTY